MIEILHYDVFTTTPGTGNPAGVVLNADSPSRRFSTDDARSSIICIRFD